MTANVAEVEGYANLDGEARVMLRLRDLPSRVFDAAECAALIAQLTQALAEAEQAEQEWVRPESDEGVLQ